VGSLSGLDLTGSGESCCPEYAGKELGRGSANFYESINLSASGEKISIVRMCIERAMYSGVALSYHDYITMLAINRDGNVRSKNYA
jgi:hypothetical protein